MGKLFGTDGIRAVAGDYPLDRPTIHRLGKHLVSSGLGRILIGRDTRASGPWMEQVLKAAVESNGGQAGLAGVMTTPGVAYLTRSQSWDAGVVISASHNPFHDNGIKVFSSQGVKLTDAEEEQLEEAILADEETIPEESLSAPAQEELRGSRPEFVERYLEFLCQVLESAPLKQLKVVLDCANGASFHVAPEVFRRLGAEVIPLHVDPDGCNINAGCGALHPQKMATAVVEHGAAFGVAFDGDSDRSIFADEQGRLLDGDYILLMLARHLRASNSSLQAVVSTVMANLGLEVALKAEGIRLIRTKVGDRYVLESMLEGDHPLGGEQSGHIIIRRYSLAGDGILTALKIAQLHVQSGLPLSTLAQGLQKCPQVLVNVPVREKVDFQEIPGIRLAIEEAESTMGERGRVVIRYSGTEPLVRIMLEGQEQKEIQTFADAIALRFRELLG